MEISIKNFKKNFDTAIIKNAEKLTVRELEEVASGKYICFVDDKNDSLDVHVTLDKKGTIIDYSCECELGSGNMCLHIISALLKIDSKEKTVQKETKKLAKEAPAVLLLRQVEEEQLKAWLKELLIANKDLQMAFVHRFSERKTDYQKGDVTKMTIDAIKSVIKGNKKNVEISEIKKIVSLWKDIHRPVIEQYLQCPSKKSNFELIQELITSAKDFNQNIYTNSNKIAKYLEEIENEIIRFVSQLSDEDFVLVLSFYLSHFLAHRTEDAIYIGFWQKAFELADENRKRLLTEKMASKLEGVDKSVYYNGAILDKTLLSFLEETQLFEKYAAICQPIQFDNDYNLRLLRQLMDIGQDALAEKYSIAQIRNNFREEFNVPYWEILKEIYTRKGLEDSAVQMMELLLPYTFDFDDYTNIIEKFTTDGERKSFRTKIIIRARNKSRNGQANASRFLFGLFAQEQNYKKMFEEVDTRTRYSILIQYFDELYRVSKREFLIKLLNHGNDEFIGFVRISENNEEKTEQVEQLVDMIFAHYDKTDLREVLSSLEKSQRWIHMGRQPILEKVKERLANA